MTFTIATPRIASHVIIRQKNKIVFVLRSNTGWMNGFYGLPSGKVEKNESYTAAGIREAKEEVGITVRAEDLKFRHLMHRHEGEGEDWVDVFFEARKWHGEPVNNEPDVHGELAWLDPNEMPENVVPSVRHALNQIMAEQLFSEYGW